MKLVTVGGSDAGISAALRALELDPTVEVTVIAEDAYPNFSICGIPYYLSGEVHAWTDLAHRSRDDLEALGIKLRLDTRVTGIDTQRHRVRCEASGAVDEVAWDRLVIATGAVPIAPPIAGLDVARGGDRVFFVHTIADARAIMARLEATSVRQALVIGAGYIGLELADGLTTRGVNVQQIEAQPQILATVDAPLATLLANELVANGVELSTNTLATSISVDDRSIRVTTVDARTGQVRVLTAEIAIVVTGVRPSTELAVAAGARLGTSGAIWVDRRMQTGVSDLFAAGDCVITHHQMLGESYLPLGTTAHKQGRIAGAQAVGHTGEEFMGVVGTQVVKVFGQVIARTGLTEAEAERVGFTPLTVLASTDDHKRYYPGAETLSITITGDRLTHRLLGVAMLGPISGAVHKRIDVAALALHGAMTIDELLALDLAYTPPLGTPWDALQVTASQWLSALGDGSHRLASPSPDRIMP